MIHTRPTKESLVLQIVLPGTGRVSPADSLCIVLVVPLVPFRWCWSSPRAFAAFTGVRFLFRLWPVCVCVCLLVPFLASEFGLRGQVPGSCHSCIWSIRDHAAGDFWTNLPILLMVCYDYMRSDASRLCDNKYVDPNKKNISSNVNKIDPRDIWNAYKKTFNYDIFYSTIKLTVVCHDHHVRRVTKNQ